jgi:ferric-dicitrate binding protein FerR (iron transport regulator)
MSDHLHVACRDACTLWAQAAALPGCTWETWEALWSAAEAAKCAVTGRTPRKPRKRAYTRRKTFACLQGDGGVSAHRSGMVGKF